MNGELSLLDSQENTFETTEESSFLIQNVTNNSIVSEEVEQKKVPLANTSFDRHVNELSEKFSNIFKEATEEAPKNSLSDYCISMESSPIESNCVKSVEIKVEQKVPKVNEIKKIQNENVKLEIKPKPQVKAAAEPVKPKILFKTFDVERAHEDIILCIDLCTASNLIVTGR